MHSSTRRWQRPRAETPFFELPPPRSAAEEIYEQLSDAELVAFVADRLPKLAWRIGRKPRCSICRPAIVAEILHRPPHAITEEPCDHLGT